MKLTITKLAHSCLLVEADQPVLRVALFDPGEMSAGTVRAATISQLDDIIITHEHYDHCNVPLIQELAARFPRVRILATQPVVEQLATLGVQASMQPAQGLQLFESPHESGAPLGDPPQEIGVHFLDVLSDPGDSHHFTESKAVLALPIDAPWGATSRAVQIATERKPKFVIPVHDVMWTDIWRQGMYARLTEYFKGQGITFISPVNGVPFTIEV